MTDYFAAAQLTARKLQEETGLSLAELAALPLDEYSRLAYGQTPAQAAIAEFNRQQDASQTSEASTPPAPQTQQTPPPAPEPAPQGLTADDIKAMGWDEYQALRQAAGIGQGSYGRGILNQSGTQSWVEAAQRQPGRSSWQARNVTDAPRIEGRYVRRDDLRDSRTLGQRFSNPSNFFGS